MRGRGSQHHAVTRAEHDFRQRREALQQQDALGHLEIGLGQNRDHFEAFFHELLERPDLQAAGEIDRIRIVEMENLQCRLQAEALGTADRILEMIFKRPVERRERDQLQLQPHDTLALPWPGSAPVDQQPGFGVADRKFLPVGQGGNIGLVKAETDEAAGMAA